MGESQLKRLKASLRQAGITGQLKPKKACTKQKQSGSRSNDSRLDRHVALQSIREEFNPFEIKTTREKHLISGRGKVKGAQGRPGLSKQIGEDNRKRTLLVEIQRRNKVGGIVDRRFGENDPTMAPEEKMLERFTKEKQKRIRGGDIFDLEDNQLTHFGQSLGADDFDTGNEMMLSGDDMLGRRLKKRRIDPENGEGIGSGSVGNPEKKSKAEVMKEVIAKSKLHKYERQKAKEGDEEEREKLDAQMSDIWALLGRRQVPKISGPGTNANMVPVPRVDEPHQKEADSKINPVRLAIMTGKEDAKYDARVREMVYDKRSQPAERTKTAEEKALGENERLRKLEEARERRMRGEEDTEGEKAATDGDNELDFGDATKYGLGRGIPEAEITYKHQENPDELLEGGYEVSEDGYVDVSDDMVVDDSGAEFSDDFDSDDETATDPSEGEDDDDFLTDVMPSRKARGVALDLSKPLDEQSKVDKLAFIFRCPQSHEELLEIVKNIPVSDVPTVVQRIRVLHHPKLHAENKTKLAKFASILLEHITYLANLSPTNPPFAPLETLIRHLHAMSKSCPEHIAEAFRTHLKDLNENRTTGDLTAGDLLLFTTISTIFPTSDHFHQVVTPAMVVICKWLGQVAPNSLDRLGMGTYLVSLCVQYQKLSRRVIPEAIGYVLQALSILAPTAQAELPGNFLYYEAAETLRISKSKFGGARKLKFADIFTSERPIGVKQNTQSALVYTLLCLLEELAKLWVGKKAFTEVFQPAVEVVAHFQSKECKGKLGQDLKNKLRTTHTTLTIHLARAHLSRRPLELHSHRPLPIKTYIPKFEESYSADKRSYDPDRERSQLAKLKTEHKRERKSALRELRKDSSFVAREKLKEDKKASKEYHAKMTKLTAMIQTEEGAAGNEYKRQKTR